MPEVASLFCRNRNRKEAFTLLELLIVILLLSLMAMLVFGSMSRQRPGIEKPGISQMKQLVQEIPAEGIELICLDNCSRCFLRDANREMHSVPYSFKPVNAYIVDPYDETKKLDFGRIKDHRICLRFYFRSNGSTSRMIVGSEGKFYYIPSYFGDVREFSSLEKARSHWLRNSDLHSDLLGNRGDYY